jgi:Dyp-type peroxidase family
LFEKTQNDLVACAKLAAQMVGRWRSGCPLALSPEVDNPALQDEDVFGYDTDDHFGVKVPIGSHIRRANPRDSLEPGPGGIGRLLPDESRRITLLHRMIRRGRPYGPPVHPSMEPEAILASSPSTDNEDRGLLFICFNASIARQFEFVQQTWLNNPKFGGLYEDSDPILGQRHPGQDVTSVDSFTAQGSPVGRRYRSLPEFVRVRGGAYFFMPGIEALKYLAGLPANLPRSYPEELGESPDSSLPPSGSSTRSQP